MSTTQDSTLDTTQSHPPVVRRFTNHIIGCPSCGNPVDELRDDPKGDFVLAPHYDELLAALRAMVSCEYGTEAALIATRQARAAIAKAEGRS